METYNEQRPLSTWRVIIEFGADDLSELKAVFPMADTAEENERLEKFVRERLG